MRKASAQVADAKSLPREDVRFEELDPYLSALPITVEAPAGFPKTRNPMYGAIISREVRLKKGDELPTKRQDIHDGLVGAKVNETPPDLIIAGKSNILLPYVRDGSTLTYHSPFHVDGVTRLHAFPVDDDLAFGIGLCALLHALDFIRLGVIPWKALLAEALNQELS